VVDTSLVGVVMNGLSHLKNVGSKAQFAVCLIRGLGGNLSEASRENLAREVGHFPLKCALFTAASHNSYFSLTVEWVKMICQLKY